MQNMLGPSTPHRAPAMFSGPGPTPPPRHSTPLAGPGMLARWPGPSAPPPSPAWGSLWRSCKNTVSKVNYTTATPFTQERLSIAFTARREQHNSNDLACKCCNTVSKVNNNTATPFLQERLFMSIGFTTRGKQASRGMTNR